MVYISLNTSTKALSPFCTRMLSTVIRYRMHLAQRPFSNPLLASSRISSAIYFSWKSINSPLLYLPALCTWARQTLVLRRDPKRSRSARFSLNFTLPLPSTMSLKTLQILISPRNRLTEALARASLKPPHSPKVQKDKFQADQHTKAVLTGMPSPLTSTQTSFPLA